MSSQEIADDHVAGRQGESSSEEGAETSVSKKAGDEAERYTGTATLSVEQTSGEDRVPGCWQFDLNLIKAKSKHAEAQEKYRVQNESDGVKQVNVRVPIESAGFFQAIAKAARARPNLFSGIDLDELDVAEAIEMLTGKTM